MFDTIILLTNPVERSIFSSVLYAHNPDLAVLPVATLEDLNSLDLDILTQARLIAYTTSVIVPADILNHLGYGAYNFHPGPPAYPGWAPAHFAMHDRATEFGATAHEMVERVDEGPIVAMQTFSIPPGISVAGLEGMAYARLSYLFWSLARTLAISSEPLARLPVRWSGKKNTRRGYAAISNIKLDIAKKEFDRPALIHHAKSGTRPSLIGRDMAWQHRSHAAAE